MAQILTPQQFGQVPLLIRQLAGAQSGERSQNTVLLDSNSALAQAKSVVSANKQNYGLKSKDPRYLTQRIENSYKKGNEYSQFNGDLFQTYGLDNFKTTYTASGVQTNIAPYVYKKKIYFSPMSQNKEVKSLKTGKMVRILDKTGRPYLITNKKIRKIFGYVHPIVQLITAHNQLQSAINRYNLYLKSGSEENYNQFLAVQATLRKMGQPAVQMSQYLKASGGGQKQTVDQLVQNLNNQVQGKVQKVQNFSNQQIAKIQNKPNKVSALIQGSVQIPIAQYQQLQVPINEQIQQEMAGGQDIEIMGNIAVQKATSLAQADGVNLNEAQLDFINERIGQIAAANNQFSFNLVTSLAKTTFASLNKWLKKAGIEVKDFYNLK